ncbi:SAM-dependent methyltransferase [Actinoplanes regularis]|uniref:S-adenosyl methyltransferase n=1 Tax=Actinoplanes regularis TaxID=52697 RepID=A0A239IXG8_9ACTN|nr:SAM-dependent methyltransferase [Actinoplanes regularis]GIE91596.1 hypothetical protein Are01nite_80760 [Actinoplanes regularis]SNS97723.1 S-adenosyl methyltransferase [Actinoplanes regularis]
MTAEELNSRLDTTVANPARRYDYWLGGKDNFAADRESGDAIEAVYPAIRTAAVENRMFLRRAVRYLATEAGIRQFLDIGTGLPTAENTHQVAQEINPTSRIVYVDNDPLVLAHARALLTSQPAGRTAYIEADLREPAEIFNAEELVDILDLREPVALLLVAVMHFVPDDEQAYTVVKTLTNALPADSCLVVSHATYDFLPADIADVFTAKSLPGAGDFTGRSREQFLRFFDGLDLIAPGAEMVSQWRPESSSASPPKPVSVYGAVARKP